MQRRALFAGNPAALGERAIVEGRDPPDLRARVQVTETPVLRHIALQTEKAPDSRGLSWKD